MAKSVRIEMPNPQTAREITSLVDIEKELFLKWSIHLYFALNIKIMTAWMKAKEFARIIGISFM